MKGRRIWDGAMGSSLTLGHSDMVILMLVYERAGLQNIEDTCCIGGIGANELFGENAFACLADGFGKA